MEILNVQNLSKRYKNTVALNGVNLTLQSGCVMGLLGPNGSGKTTFIKCVAGLLSAESGEIRVCGNKVGAESKSITAYLPDKNFLCEWMTVIQMLNYTRDFFEDFRMQRALTMIERLGIKQSDRIKTLSKGTKEKLALIITMSRDARLYILDEPIAGVDPAARDYVIKTVLNNFSPESSVLISTHLIKDIEDVLTDVVFLHCGNVALVGKAEELREQSGKTIDELFREKFAC